jgi:tetratricopeptide (TPR) repeat protein
MERLGIPPNNSIQFQILKYFAQKGDVTTVAQRIRSMSAVNSENSSLAYNYLLSAYAATGSIESLSMVINTMRESHIPLDAYSFKAIARAYTTANDCKTLVDGLVRLCNGEQPLDAQRMVLQSCDLPIVSWPGLLIIASYHMRAKNPSGIRQLIDLAHALKLEPSISMYNKLLKCYSNQSMKQEIASTVDEMKRIGVEPDSNTIRQLADAHAASGNFHAIRLLAQDYRRQHAGDTDTALELYRLLAHAYANSGSVNGVLRVIQIDAVDASLQTNHALYTELVRAYLNTDDAERAFQVITTDMPNANVTPSVDTYLPLVEHYAALERIDVALEILEHARSVYGLASVTLFRPIVRFMYASDCHPHQIEFLMHNTMPKFGVRADLTCYQELAKTYARRGKFKKALSMLCGRIRAGAIQPNGINVFNCVLASCTSSAQAHECFALLQDVSQEFGLPIGPETYYSLVTSFCKAKDVGSAQYMIYTIMPDAAINVPLDLCNKYLQLLLATDATPLAIQHEMHKLQQLHGVKPDVTSYLTLIHCHLFNNDLPAAEKVICDTMVRAAVAIDLTCFEPIALAYAEQSLPHQVRRVFVDLPRKYGLTPNLSCYKLLIQAYLAVQDFKRVIEICTTELTLPVVEGNAALAQLYHQALERIK